MDLERVKYIRESSRDELQDCNYIEQMMCKLGFNDELLWEQPEIVRANTGGLKIWQYPNQFSKYLKFLSDKNITSYLEIGCRWGGTFVLTTEYLKKFNNLTESVAVDLIDSPVAEYTGGTFIKMNSMSQEFSEYIASKQFDLVLIDGDHTYEGAKSDYLLVKDHAKIIVFHDITSVACPGVMKIWNEIKHEYDFHEFTQQYHEVPSSFLGIGVAVKKV
jgi:hypothetical protein